ncbi:sulfatase family protein [Actinoplanes awajinensis]|uniref:Sulfatase n=1 Tax=Actinoplanes awajinensis subsp. mycoplanecinus TaxID=135947 RepID=A0A101JD18_9ACTN|nr:sulfatase [Actinoplanes awajinensis]KUL24511.1 sulfatase [Actinoplanes awajinensis subsp. mycoplanecinus]
MIPRLRRALAGVLAVTLLAAAGCTADDWPAVPAPSTATGGDPRPNIVFVLTDDLSTNLVPYLPSVLALQKEGTTFTDYTVTDSLCCPSRASILRGQYPHHTGIFKNHGADGGFQLFHSRGEEKSTFATDLQAAGYRTAFLGKYLNEYLPRNTQGTGRPYVPPGWDEWYVGGNAYQNYDYALNENGVVTTYGHRPQDYLTDVLSAKASAFITTAAASGRPFMMEVATYTPHSPYTPAAADTAKFLDVKAPRTAAYDTIPDHAPHWLSRHAPLTTKQRQTLDLEFRRRVQAVQSVDRMITSLRATLDRAGVAGDTIVVFNSDNGYHMGEYRLTSGKQTAFDTDVNVPLVVAGPGVRAGQTVPAVVENIDLRPTFAELAGTTAPAPEVDGRSLVPLLSGATPPDWRDTALIEHRDPATDPHDPDYERDSANIPPAYNALRTRTFTYVEYVDRSKEFYDRTTDPAMLDNVIAQLTPQRLAQLHQQVLTLTACEGQSACATAGRSQRSGS